jgi:hypothetical protein
MVMKSDGVRSVGKTQGVVDTGGGEDDDVNVGVGEGVVKVEDDEEVTDDDTCCAGWYCV